MARKAAALRTDMRSMAGILHAIADTTRLSLLLLLFAGEWDVSSLCERVHLTQPTVSHHLGLLRMSNLVTTRRNGRQVFYSLSPQVRSDGQGGFTVQGGALELQVSFNSQREMSAR